MESFLLKSALEAHCINFKQGDIVELRENFGEYSKGERAIVYESTSEGDYTSFQIRFLTGGYKDKDSDTMPKKLFRKVS